MARMTYTKAIQWIVDNDDTDWVGDPDGSPSVTVVFMADIYNVEVEQIVRAIEKAKKKEAKKS